MPARLNKRQATNTRSAIQVGLIVKHLEEHTLGKREMSNTQIAAARILLDKALPNLQATQISGEGGGPLEVWFNVRLTG